jgi:DNA-directed RNA polymerase subunit beta
VTNEVIYLSAMEEARFRVAQANIGIDDNGKLTDELINCRINGDFEMVPADMVNLLDVSPKQIVSVAAALIPFLENDDANRALDGIEHATSSSAAAASRSPAGRNRHGRSGGAR